MSSEETVLAEVGILRARMGCVFAGKGYLQDAPPLSVLVPRFNLVRFEARIGEEKRVCEVAPERVAAEIPGMQFVPFGICGLAREGFHQMNLIQQTAQCPGP